MASIIARDLSGAADLDENLLSISALASSVVNTAYSIAARGLSERYGTPTDEKGRPIDLMVVGMGKLGGNELNASSDIDLIYLVAEAGQTTGLTDGSGVIDSFSFFERCSRRISQLLNEPTADGFVFRIDLRLRPNGESGPIICSLPMLEEYLMVQGREWERYAWIKARVINGAVLSDPTDFEWLSQLRYYWEDGNMMVGGERVHLSIGHHH
jgi:glutamate-ammonia-ligase adenylyltransferase